MHAALYPSRPRSCAPLNQRKLLSLGSSAPVAHSSPQPQQLRTSGDPPHSALQQSVHAALPPRLPHLLHPAVGLSVSSRHSAASQAEALTMRSPTPSQAEGLTMRSPTPGDCRSQAPAACVRAACGGPGLPAWPRGRHCGTPPRCQPSRTRRLRSSCSSGSTCARGSTHRQSRCSNACRAQCRGADQAAAAAAAARASSANSEWARAGEARGEDRGGWSPWRATTPGQARQD